MAAKAVVLAVAAVAVVLCGLIATRMGSEFVPNLNEGDFAVQALRIPGTSLTQSVAMQQQLEATLKAKFPEIERIFARTGTAEIASDPMPPNISDGYIMLKPQSSGLSHASHVTSCSRRCRKSLARFRATTTSSLSRFNCGSTNSSQGCAVTLR
jgi:Cu/Ag efflux pump CusA